MQTIRQTAGMLGLAALLACGESRAFPASEAAPALARAVVLEAASPSGVVVRIRTEPDPPSTGWLRVFVTVVRRGDRKPQSVDLVSPAMPMHGIARYAVRALGTDWIADLDIPMEGEWSVYVNFDDGTDAAEFRFVVGEAQSHTQQHHHTEEDKP